MIGFEIDTIKLFIHINDLDGYDFGRLYNMLYNSSKCNGWQNGNYYNFYISYNEEIGICLNGSLSNFYNGYSKRLKFNQIENAIGKLSNELCLDLSTAKLRRIDLACNIETDQSVERYTHNLLMDLSRFIKLQQGQGVLFSNNLKAILMYNKSAELKANRNIIVHNILRLEYRLKNGTSVSNLIGHTGVVMADFYSIENYKKLLDSFWNLYSKIKKCKFNASFKEDVITPRGFNELLKLKGLEKIEEEIDCFEFIKDLDSQGKFPTRQDVFRTRKQITELKNKSITIGGHALLVKELNEKIEIEYQKALIEIGA